MFCRFPLSLFAAAALALVPLSANALGITVTSFGMNSLPAAQSNFSTQLGTLAPFTVTENFESFGTSVGVKQIGATSGTSLSTAVGSFTTLTDSTIAAQRGSGSTAIGTAMGTISDTDRGRNLSIRQNGDDPDNGGRQNTTVGGSTYLDSNDTRGIKWTVANSANPTLAFTSLLFTLTDPSDQGKTLTISASGITQTYTLQPGQSNGRIFNVLIGFSSAVTGATVTLAKNGVNDGFSIDNATIGAVPLPAAAWLLLGVSGALVAAKRRSARRAA